MQLVPTEHPDQRSGTTQPTPSAYEHGTKSPTLAVLERIVDSPRIHPRLVPHVTFTTRPGARGAPFVVPDQLWRLDTADALATITLPRHLRWSGPTRTYRLRDRRDRARVYEVVLRKGTREDLRTSVDGALLVDQWDDLLLPRSISRRGIR